MPLEYWIVECDKQFTVGIAIKKSYAAAKAMIAWELKRLHPNKEYSIITINNSGGMQL